MRRQTGNNRAQSTLEYLIVLAVITAIIFAAATNIIKPAVDESMDKLGNVIKQAADEF